ncbi:MAG TPA: hypothetical protein DCE52_06745 [Rhodobacteraceae bacterium]|nr:hypothetical protein [Paracoccaceae bacterium]
MVMECIAVLMNAEDLIFAGSAQNLLQVGCVFDHSDPLAKAEKFHFFVQPVTPQQGFISAIF